MSRGLPCFSPSPTSLQRVSFVGAPGKTILIALNHFRPEPTAGLQDRVTQIHACHLRLTPTAGSQVRIKPGCSNLMPPGRLVHPGRWRDLMLRPMLRYPVIV